MGGGAVATGRRAVGGRSAEFRHRVLLNKGMVREGETVVFTAGVPVGVSGGTNMIKVVKVEKAD
ncbi:MAG: pyruvate kinase alpha/beta domain-containing protein [Candidatus Competibacteraceae bacterium]